MNQGSRVISKTIDADNVIYNYEWFYSRWEDVLAHDKNVAIADEAYENFLSMLSADREKWTYMDRQELSRLKSVAVGNKQHRNALAAEYNARNSMINRKWLNRGLPESIEIK